MFLLRVLKEWESTCKSRRLRCDGYDHLSEVVLHFYVLALDDKQMMTGNMNIIGWVGWVCSATIAELFMLLQGI